MALAPWTFVLAHLEIQYHVKGVVIRNTHTKYETSALNGLKVKAKVKVFVHTSDADARDMTLAPRTFISVP